MATNPNQPAPGTVNKPTTVPPAGAAPAGAAPAAGTAPAGPNGQTDGTEAKKEKKEKTKTGVSRPRLARPDENFVITVLKPGIKTGKSGQRYDMYRNGMTVKEYVDLMTTPEWGRTVGQVYHTLRWDTDPNRKLINIGPTVVPVPPPPEPKAKAPKEPKEPKEKEASKPAA